MKIAIQCRLYETIGVDNLLSKMGIDPYDRQTDGLMQEACVYTFINITGNLLELAENSFVFYNNKVITIYGVFENSQYGYKSLSDAIATYDNNKSEGLQNISDIIKTA